MDEKSAVAQAIKGRISVLKLFNEPDLGMFTMLDLMQVDFMKNPGIVPKYAWHAEEMRKFFIEGMTHAPTFIIPETECKTINDNWNAYPGARAFPSDILRPTGFVFFAKPIDDPWDKDPTASIQAMSWLVCKNIDAPLFIRDIEEDDFVLTLLVYGKGSPLATPEFMPRLYPLASVAWALDRANGGQLTDNLKMHLEGMKYRTTYMKVLLSFFAVMRQNAFQEGEPRTPLSGNMTDKVEGAKKEYPGYNPEVKVVRYRQRTGSGTASYKPKTGRRQKVRSWVAPFWKWVWYPSLSDNKPCLIEPFARGPEGGKEVGATRIFKPAKALGEKPEH